MMLVALFAALALLLAVDRRLRRDRLRRGRAPARVRGAAGARSDARADRPAGAARGRPAGGGGRRARARRGLRHRPRDAGPVVRRRPRRPARLRRRRCRCWRWRRSSRACGRCGARRRRTSSTCCARNREREDDRGSDTIASDAQRPRRGDRRAASRPRPRASAQTAPKKTASSCRPCRTPTRATSTTCSATGSSRPCARCPTGRKVPRLLERAAPRRRPGPRRVPRGERRGRDLVRHGHAAELQRRSWTAGSWSARAAAAGSSTSAPRGARGDEMRIEQTFGVAERRAFGPADPLLRHPEGPLLLDRRPLDGRRQDLGQGLPADRGAPHRPVPLASRPGPCAQQEVAVRLGPPASAAPGS